jgi:hypothetical protein
VKRLSYRVLFPRVGSVTRLGDPDAGRRARARDDEEAAGVQGDYVGLVEAGGLVVHRRDRLDRGEAGVVPAMALIIFKHTH